MSSCKIYIDGVLAATKSLAALDANTKLQPIVAIQRWWPTELSEAEVARISEEHASERTDAGTELEVVTIDYIHVVSER